MLIHVSQYDSENDTVRLTPFEVPEATTFSDFIVSHGLQGQDVGLWCHHVKPETVLHEGDRIDCGTPLFVEPQEARRLRAQSREKNRLEPISRHGSKHVLVKSI